jgi:hypothetical protein
MTARIHRRSCLTLVGVSALAAVWPLGGAVDGYAGEPADRAHARHRGAANATRAG